MSRYRPRAGRLNDPCSPANRYVCPHTEPACPPGTRTWDCCKRTEIEAGLADGSLSLKDATRLAELHRVPLGRPKPARVYKGEPARKIQDKLW